MPASVRRCYIESLENRRLAAATAGNLVKFPGVSYGTDGSIYIDGSVGADTITARVAKRQIYLDITSRVYVAGIGSYGIAAIPIASSHVRVDPTSSAFRQEDDFAVSVQTFVFPAVGHPVISIDGGDGADTVRATQLPINVVATKVEQPEISPAIASAGSTPSDPVAGSLYGSPTAWTDKLHRQLKAVKTSRAEIAFFGDSHADRFEYYGRGSWLAAFPKALNLGVGGDNTRNMLYRIKAGLFDAFKPATLVVMAGTNDLNNSATDGTDDQIYTGLTNVIAALHRKLPNTRLVIVSVFPRGESGLNTRIHTLNSRVEALARRSGVFEVLNVYDRLADTFDQHDLVNPDNHLSAAGYKVITRYLTALLRTDPRDFAGPIQSIV